MDFLQLAQDRYSMRGFATKQVAKEDLEKILEAGRLAPTAVNYQPQRILVIQTSEALKKVKECTKFHFNAPTILLVGYDSSASWKNPYNNSDAGIIDAAIVATHMMLEATDLGLGTTFVGHFDPQKLAAELDLPEFLYPVALLPLGYPAPDTKPHKLHFQRKPLSDTVFYNSFKELKKGFVDESQHKILL